MLAVECVPIVDRGIVAGEAVKSHARLHPTGWDPPEVRESSGRKGLPNK